MSPERSDIEDARMWFNCVEELVFTDEDFNSDLASTGSNPTLHRNIVQALQAAYMVCLYQNWEGSDASKRRIRRYRYSNLVSVSFTFSIPRIKLISRLLGISILQRSDTPTTASTLATNSNGKTLQLVKS